MTCFEKVSWKVNNLEQNIIVHEAWSKGWPDQKKEKVLKKQSMLKISIGLKHGQKTIFYLSLKNFISINFLS